MASQRFSCLVQDRICLNQNYDKNPMTSCERILIIIYHLPPGVVDCESCGRQQGAPSLLHRRTARQFSRHSAPLLFSCGVLVTLGQRSVKTPGFTEELFHPNVSLDRRGLLMTSKSGLQTKGSR